MQKENKKKLSVILLILTLGLLTWGLYKSGYIPKKLSLNGKSLDIHSNQKSVFTSYNGEFSFAYPMEFTENTFNQEVEGEKTFETTVFTSPANTQGFQLAISDYSDNDVPTIEKVKKDNPGIVMSDEHDIEISGARGVAFLDMELRDNPVRNIWFVHDKKLYQITTYKSFDDTMSDILSSWKWIAQ